MHKRNSVYRSSNPPYTTDGFNNEAMAAANALGKALVNNGRHVDRTKLPVYNSPQLAYSMSTLNKTGNAQNLNKRYSSLTSKNSTPMSSNNNSSISVTKNNRDKENITKNSNPTPKKKILRRSNSQIISRRTSSLPNNRYSLTSDNKLSNITYKEHLEAKRTFQEFGGKQTVSKVNNLPNSHPNQSNNKKKFIKKYVPGPNGLVAVQIPVEEIERRNSLIERRNSLRFNSLSSLNSSNSNKSNKIYNSHNNNNNNTPSKNKRHSLTKKHFKESNSNLNSLSHRQQQQQSNQHQQQHFSDDDETHSKLTSNSPTKTPEQPLIESLLEEETELELELDDANINMNSSDFTTNRATTAATNKTGNSNNNIHKETNDHDQMLSDLLKENVALSDSKLSECDKEMFEEVQELEELQNQLEKDEASNDDKDDEKIVKSENESNEVKIINKLVEPLLTLSHKDSDSSYVTTQETTDSLNDDKNEDTLIENQTSTVVESEITNRDNNNDIANIDSKDTTHNDTNDTINDDKMVVEPDNTVSSSHISNSPFVIPSKNPSRTKSANYQKMMNNDTLIINEITVEDHLDDKRSTKDAALSPSESSEEEKTIDVYGKESNNKNNMASYLRSMNPYLINSNDNVSNTHSNDHKNKTETTNESNGNKFESPKTVSTKKTVPVATPTSKQKLASSNATSKNNHLITNNKNASSNAHAKDLDHLKPPTRTPRLKTGVKTPIKSALKKTPSVTYSQHDSSSSSSPYNKIKTTSTTAEGAYLKLTTAENTRLNAQLSSENLLRKTPSTRIVRSQSVMNNKTSNQIPKNNKSNTNSVKNGANKKPPMSNNKASVNTKNAHNTPTANNKRLSQVPKNRVNVNATKHLQRDSKHSTSKVQDAAKNMANDPNLASILYPVEPPQRKSSFEKIRTKEDHLGFKNLSLRQDVAADELNDATNMNSKFHHQVPSSNASLSQRRSSNSSHGNEQNLGFLSGFSSRFQDSDDEDGFLPPPTPNYSNGGRSGSDSFKFGLPNSRHNSNDSPNKEKKSSGFSLFKKHSNNKDNNSTTHSSGGNKIISPSSTLPAGSSMTSNQLRSGSNNPHVSSSISSSSQPQRSTSAPNVARTMDNTTKEHKSNKFGTKLKKLFGRNH